MNDVGDLITMAKDSPSTKNLEAMWLRVMALPAWYLLPANEGPSTPLVLQLEDGDWVVVFTHVRPLNEYAAARGEENIDILPIAPTEVLARVDDVAEHVSGFVFNPTTAMAFRAPRSMFPSLVELIPERPTPPE